MENRKRKNTDADEADPHKRRKIVDWDTMISPSNIRNYILEDPLLDWLKYYSISSIYDKPHKKQETTHPSASASILNSTLNSTLTFNNFIMEQGNLFEKIVYENLKDRFNIVQVTTNNESRSYEKYVETLDYMKEGVDIIYQGVLHDYKKSLYGVPDLLVRSDKFNEIFNQNISFREPYFYVVVDIKHSNIELNCNKTYIKDTNSIPAYKGQILIYNKILSDIQQYSPPYGFILSKKITYTKKNIIYSSDNFMENISVIDYTGYDSKYKDIVESAINWVKKLRTEGHTWSLLPKPSIKELYPNMKNDKDEGYRTIKSELADKIGEITNIWWCGYKKRNIAHSKNIFSWTDKNFNARIVDFKDSKISAMINNILEINRNNGEIVRKEDLLKSDDLREIENVMEFYIDFETINGNIGQIQIPTIDQPPSDIIFMVCIGWENNHRWEHKSFMINRYTDEDELAMINNMWEHVNLKMQEFNKTDYRFIHWTHAEITFYNKFLSKHPAGFSRFKSFDLYKIFLDNNIVIKGAYNFSLKTIANAMFKNGLINTCWDSNSICTNGLQAMYLAYNLYKNTDYVDETNNTMSEIIRYNVIDCKVMWEIITYLRQLFNG